MNMDPKNYIPEHVTLPVFLAENRSGTGFPSETPSTYPFLILFDFPTTSRKTRSQLPDFLAGTGWIFCFLTFVNRFF